jgi:hypothetical protein
VDALDQEQLGWRTRRQRLVGLADQLVNARSGDADIQVVSTDIALLLVVARLAPTFPQDRLGTVTGGDARQRAARVV